MTIKCQPEAAPTPEITWSQNGQVITIDDKHTVSLDGTLHIAQMTASDQGSYTCKARNQNGETEASTVVSVFGKCPLELCALFRCVRTAIVRNSVDTFFVKSCLIINVDNHFSEI